MTDGREHWASDRYWVWTGFFDTAIELGRGITDILRLGEGVGSLDWRCATAWDIAGAFAEDGLRALGMAPGLGSTAKFLKNAKHIVQPPKNAVGPLFSRSVEVLKRTGRPKLPSLRPAPKPPSLPQTARPPQALKPARGLDNAGEGVSNAAERLTKGDITDYLSNTKGKTHAEISQDLQGLGLKVKGQSPAGRFTEFVDKAGNVRAKLHPPDKVTNHPHLHVYDEKGNALDAGLNKVSPKSPNAHIETGG